MPEPAPLEVSRRLTRQETHDLSMIIRDRTKVLKAHASEQAAACLADFERQMASVYSFDDDEVWQKAKRDVQRVAEEAAEKIAERCKDLGIPARFAPSLQVLWHGRGENGIGARRMELRRVAQASIAAMQKAAETRIEKQSLDLRTQVVALGVLSEDAKMFLESLASVDDAMQAISFKDIERRVDSQRDSRRLSYGDYEP